MDKKVKLQFEHARRAYDTMTQEIAGELSLYRSKLGEIRSRATAFKNEQEYIDQHRAELAQATRRKIDAAEKSFCDVINGEVVPALRAELAGHITAQPKADFMRTLSYYQQFGIPVDEQEVRLLAYDCEGNFLALRALASVAQKSGIAVKFPSVAEYGKVIDRLERMAQPPLMYCPFDYLTEGVAILPDTPLRRADGSVYGTNGRPTSTGLIVSTQGMENTMKAVAEAGDTWSAAVVPEIGAYTDEKDEDGEVVSTAAEQRAMDKLTAAQQIKADSGEAVELARKLGKDAAQGKAQVVPGLAHYL